MVVGSETTKGFLLTELYERAKENEREGCTFGKISREKIESNERRTGDLIKNIEAVVTLYTRAMQGQMYLTFAVVLMAVMTGGTLVWNILKAFKVVP